MKRLRKRLWLRRRAATLRREQLDTTGTLRWAYFEDNALSPHHPEDAHAPRDPTWGEPGRARDHLAG